MKIWLKVLVLVCVCAVAIVFVVSFVIHEDNITERLDIEFFDIESDSQLRVYLKNIGKTEIIITDIKVNSQNCTVIDPTVGLPFKILPTEPKGLLWLWYVKIQRGKNIMTVTTEKGNVFTLEFYA